jgi:hypothetical protein
MKTSKDKVIKSVIKKTEDSKKLKRVKKQESPPELKFWETVLLVMNITAKIRPRDKVFINQLRFFTVVWTIFISLFFLLALGVGV